MTQWIKDDVVYTEAQALVWIGKNTGLWAPSDPEPVLIAQGFTPHSPPPAVPPTPEEIAYQLAAESKRVSEAGRQFILEQEIYSTGLIMVDRIRRVEPENVIAKATDVWVEAASMEVEMRKYFVRMGLWPDGDDPADFTNTYPHKPFLITQIKPEYDRLKAAGLIP